MKKSILKKSIEFYEKFSKLGNEENLQADAFWKLGVIYKDEEEFKDIEKSVEYVVNPP